MYVCYHKDEGGRVKVLKYKKINNNRYSIELDNGDNLKLYDDTIIHYDLLRVKSIEDLEEIEKYDKDMEAYYKSLKYLNKKMRTSLEIRKYLKDYPSKTIDKTIERLTKEGYLNDFHYLRIFISNLISISMYGPYKIRNKLLELGFNKEEINEELDKYDKMVFLDKLDRLIDKRIKGNNRYSSNRLKEKIIIDLTNNGYDKGDILELLNNKRIEASGDILEKEYEKVYRSLSRKYNGYELENMILKKLLGKGFNYDDIKEIIAKNI